LHGTVLIQLAIKEKIVTGQMTWMTNADFMFARTSITDALMFIVIPHP